MAAHQGAYRGGSENRKALFKKWDVSPSIGKRAHCVANDICSVGRDVLEALYLHDLVVNPTQLIRPSDPAVSSGELSCFVCTHCLPTDSSRLASSARHIKAPGCTKRDHLAHPNSPENQRDLSPWVCDSDLVSAAWRSYQQLVGTAGPRAYSCRGVFRLMSAAYWVRSTALRHTLSSILPLSFLQYSRLLQRDCATLGRALCRYHCRF